MRDHTCGSDARPAVTGELVDLACRGDRDAQELVFREYVAPLARFASGLLPGYARGMMDTQDVVQEVLTNTARRLGSIDCDEDGALLQRLRTRFVVLATGQGAHEDASESWSAAHELGSRGVPNRVDLWGPEWPHDWQTWRAMLPHYLDTMC